VSNRDKILINDSCVLFDLVDLNLIDLFFQLNFTFFTTTQVIEEIKDETQIESINRFISNGTLNVDNSGSFESIVQLFDKYPSLSYTDSSVLELAMRLEGILISSDKRLRNVSKSNNLDVKGFLWIIYILVEEKMLEKNKAIDILTEYPKINVRAPIKDIKKLIEMINKMG
jgi:predicted nucleic acid-binding protein